MTNNNIYDLPKTATISYFDVETGQNLTAEEWQQKQPNSSEITVIDKSGGNFTSEKALNGVYGPGWWDNWGKTIVKKAASTVLVASYFTPVAPFTITATVGTAVLGGIALTGDKGDQEIGGHLLEVAADAGLGAAGVHLIPGGGSTAVKAVAASCCRHCPK